MSAKNQQIYTLNGSIEQICSILRDPGMMYELEMTIKMEAAIPNGMIFEFSHGISLTSWGENVRIILCSQSPELTTVTIISECAMPTQIIDWGKNKSNVDGVFAFINNRLLYSAPQEQVAAPAPAAPVQGGGFCTNCGTQLQQGGAFCGKCGAKIR